MDSVQIISAYLHNRNNCQTATVYQYNQGMILRIIGPTLPTAYEVDFANSVTGQSITQVGNSEGVTIPDQFFVPGSMIHAWVVLTGEDYVVTRYHIMIPISPRAVRTNEEPTPSQQSAVDQAISALNSAVDAAETAITHYPKVEDGYWYIWDVSAGEYVSTGVAAQGPQGNPGQDGTDGTDGYSPTITVTDIMGGHRVTITDADGQRSFDVMNGETPDVPVQDVQVNGVSVLNDGVANVPVANNSGFGAIKLGDGFSTDNTTLKTNVDFASADNIKAGASQKKAITPYAQHRATFYGLAKAAGDTSQSASSNAVGTYTDEAKAAIQTMLGVEQGVNFVEEVSGTAVTITGVANTRYKCGTVTTISITPPSLGTIDVVFTSGSTAAALTLPSTVKVPDWFDPTALDTDTTYELVITDGVYCGVMAWAE